MLRLSVPAPGTVRAGARAARLRVASRTRTVAKAGAVKLTLAPSRAAKRALRHRKRLKVSVRIAFKPRGGAATTLTRSVTLRKG